MKVYGVEIPEHVIDNALACMDGVAGFTCRDLEREVRIASGVTDGPALVRCADRTLQKLRKLGVIKFRHGKWFVGPETKP